MPQRIKESQLAQHATKSHPQHASKSFSSAQERFNDKWNAMFERLQEYKEEHGDCLVPHRYKEDRQLGEWVTEQRKRGSLDGPMNQERRDKLNSIGFVWRVRSPRHSPALDERWNAMFFSIDNLPEDMVHFYQEVIEDIRIYDGSLILK